MKKKIIITVFSVIAVVVLVGFLVVGNPVVSVHNNELKKAVTSIKSSETVTLNEVVPFEWDNVYTFKPYTSKDEIEKVIGFKSNSIKETVNEGMVQLIFVKDNKVTASVCQYAEDLGYDIIFGDSISYESNAKFSVETSIDKTEEIVKLTLQ